MQQITEHTSYQIDAFKGLWPKVHDVRMDAIEKTVCAHYGEAIAELKNWYNTSEARNMNAFLMHHILNHSLKYLADHYRMYYHGLRFQFGEICKRALTDKAFEKKLNSLIQACNNTILSETSSTKQKNIVNI